jgi:prolyl 4-hydroxylase
MDKDKGRPASDFRTSQTTFLKSDDATILDIDDRTASLIRVPRTHQENVQVLRYGVGEHYDSHHDYFGTWKRFIVAFWLDTSTL